MSAQFPVLSEPEPQRDSSADAPAFPTCDDLGSGLTKREWFAGQALAGITAGRGPNNRYTPDIVAEAAIAYADAVLAALAAKGGA